MAKKTPLSEQFENTQIPFNEALWAKLHKGVVQSENKKKKQRRARRAKEFELPIDKQQQNS